MNGGGPAGLALRARLQQDPVQRQRRESLRCCGKAFRRNEPRRPNRRTVPSLSTVIHLTYRHGYSAEDRCSQCSEHFISTYINERTLLCGRRARLGRSARTKKKNEWGSFGPDRGEKTLAIDTPGAISVRSLPSCYIVGPKCR